MKDEILELSSSSVLTPGVTSGVVIVEAVVVLFDLSKPCVGDSVEVDADDSRSCDLDTNGSLSRRLRCGFGSVVLCIAIGGGSAGSTSSLTVGSGSAKSALCLLMGGGSALSALCLVMGGGSAASSSTASLVGE